MINKYKIKMRELAKKYSQMWIVMAIVPTGFLISLIGRAINMETIIIISLQIPAIIIQLFAVFMIIRYRKEIYGY